VPRIDVIARIAEINECGSEQPPALSSTVTRPLIFSRYLGSKITAHVVVRRPRAFAFSSL